MVYAPSTYVTHGFVVFPEAKPRVKSTNKWVTKVHNTTRFHGVTNLYYTNCVKTSLGAGG